MLKNRHVMSRRDMRKLAMNIAESTAMEINLSGKKVEEAFFDRKKAYIIDGRIFAFQHGNIIMLSVRGLSIFPQKKKFVVIDDGGVPYVCGGANVMAPGVVDADRDIKKNDWVWVCEEKGRTPLAVGYAEMDGEEMIEKERGIAVRTVHHLGDRIWKISV